MDEKWYAVKTRSRHEKVATDMLRRKSFTVFFPEISSWSKRKDRKKLIMRPLFPGYIFIHFELDNDRWLDIRKTRGVVDLVKFRDEPEPVPDEQILSVKTVVESGVIFTNRPYLNLKKGDKVVVAKGPLQGALGIYLSSDEKKGKLVVSVDLLNRSLEVEIEQTDVERF
ncbi:MAG: UpxY family transcription antiterminator [Nitrospinae bacterium]|nr:UpxY family transcription antiterminator [Nitrospinota bacterium]